MAKDNNPELDYYLEALKAYSERGVMPNSFLRAVLSNDLMQTMSRADENSQRTLFTLCKYIFSKMPMESWGSEQQVNNYVLKKQKQKLK